MTSAGQVQKILIIKLRAIGDVLLSTVVINNLRSAFPGAEIDFLTEQMSADVVVGNPALHSVIVFDAKREGGLGLISRVRKKKYDLVIDLFGNPRSAIVTLLSGAGIRVGYRFKWRQYCYNRIVEPRGGEVHNTEFNLDALRALNIPVTSGSVAFPVDSTATSKADEFFLNEHLENAFVVGLNIGGGWYTKRWNIEHFAEFGDKIAREFHAKILVIWGPGEYERALKLQQSMKSPSILIPDTTLKELAAILKKCSVVVTNDSGPMHIAAAMQTPVLAIFGPTNPELQGPVGTVSEIVQCPQLVCLGCNLTTCPIGNPCMEELSPSIVFDAFSRLMSVVQPVHESSGTV